VEYRGWLPCRRSSLFSPRRRVPRSAPSTTSSPDAACAGPPRAWPHRVEVRDAESCRTKTRHTAHHCDYPGQITILRPRHPFEGQTLEALAWVQRRGVLYANTILPDGTRAMIPAAWSDYATQQSTSSPLPAAHGAVTLASISELLHARTVVAPLLARTRSADIGCSTPKEVEPNATDAELHTRTIQPNRGIAPSRSVGGTIR